MIYKINKKNSLKLKGEQGFEGKSLEKEMEQAMATNQPIQRAQISNIFYTQRKDGVLKETDIRTDRFEVAQNAMSHANNEFKKRIEETIQKKQPKTTEQTKTE